jgi:acetyl/propionyl-CoA carboxylase alpha subunit/acetyl-CoA carboxylase carboxyltransferase component
VREIRRLGIVNRGEPATRVLTAVAELNRAGDHPPITTVILYTDPDEHAWYVSEADEAVCLGPATFIDPADGRRKSRYLDEAAVVGALREARVDTVWVGWGFVAESASFAERCEQAGITFVGPDSATIRLLGDKVAAKLLAERAGVPVVPWSGGPVEDAGEAARHAARLGYSVVLKASGGGGGRGVRVVDDPTGLRPALDSARGEAWLAFGDPSVFIERLVPAARHVEVQIIADGYGTTWAVGIRDCSVQRRHQKVIEESASTVLDAATEQSIRDAAVRLAVTAGYRNAGTVEFLVDPRTGRFLFLEVNTRLQVEHPVTEATTGLDLVKLQLQVARGGRLDGEPPPVRGHAIEARLCAEDPERRFAPAPGRLAVLDLPTGAGIRVDTGVREGDAIAPEFDSMIAKIVAWGRDRDEAVARLRRALASTTAVVAGGTTNRSFLLCLLARPEVRSGRYDNQWLDRITAGDAHLPPADPVAVVLAAVEAYEVEHAGDLAAFRARAARGGAESPAEVGHTCALRYRGVRYALHVYRTGPCSYRVDSDSAAADVVIERLDAYRRRAVVGGVRHHVLAVVEGATLRVDVDGVSHTLTRDDGGLVRCDWPAFVVSLSVAPGDVVREGDPLAVLESMKMESTVSAPFAGVVTSVEVTANTQVDAGTPLLRIRSTGAEAAGVAAPVRLAGLAAGRPPGTAPCERVYRALATYLLGYDLDPDSLRRTIIRQRRLGAVAPPDDAGLLRCEDGLLDLFADVSALYRPRPGTEPDDPQAVGSTKEYLLAYLQWLDPDQAGLPAGYRERLERGLARYEVPSLTRTPELEDAVFWMFRSFQRLADLVPVVVGILERRLRHRDVLAHHSPPPTPDLARPALADGELRARLDRLATAAQGHHQVVADLARDVRFHYFDHPLLTAVVAKEYAQVEAELAELREATGLARLRHLDRLVGCPQPLRGVLLRWWLASAEDPAGERLRPALVEVYARRFYRIRDLRDLHVAEQDGWLLCSADFDVDGKDIHLVTAYAPLDELPRLARAVRAHRAATPSPRRTVVDVATWRPGPADDTDAVVADIGKLLPDCDFGPPLHRLDVTVTGVTGRAPEHFRTHHATFRQRASSLPTPHPQNQDGGGFVEETLYRNLHPMLAKRLDLWRLSSFDLRRMRSAEDVYLFHGVARDNPADQRLFALAEVRDLTPARDAAGAVTYPRIELIGLQALAALREARASFPERERPVANRIVIYIRPVWTVPRRAWRELARALAPLAAGAGLEKIVLRVRIPTAGGSTKDTVLHVTDLSNGVTVTLRPPGNQPIRTLTPYRQKVLRAQRFGLPYPYEIVRMLTPPPDALTHFPTGGFAEYDLDERGDLVPVQRDAGLNTANIVVGLLTNRTATVPEGMTRVVLLGDPTSGLGNLAEPECRRIIAALDLAERMRLPVDWFALSSGARIATDSGTENMDWIAAVLRRLIEFTQAGGTVNIVVTGVNVGAQPYWDAEATMLMHTRGILVMTPASAMVLTGKHALDFSGGVSAEDNFGIGGFDRIMGPNGQGQYWAGSVDEACQILLRHYDHTYVVPGERYPRRARTADPVDRDVRTAPHATVPGTDLTVVGDVFSAERNPDRKKPFDVRSVMRAVTDADSVPLERWTNWRGAETAVVWDARVGGIAVCLVGIESHTVPRRGFVPAGGPSSWTSGTLFPQSSRKLARAINAASGTVPLVMLANLSGFDGSPESMRRWQLEYGAEIGRAVTNFRGPIVFVVISRYHGGAFVVFSKALNERIEVAAIEGSYASVIGGAPAAATVFAREVAARTERDPRVREARGQAGPFLAATVAAVRSEKLGEVAAEFDAIHNIQRAREVGSVDRIIPARELRPYLVDALERGMDQDCAVPAAGMPAAGVPAAGVPAQPVVSPAPDG